MDKFRFKNFTPKDEDLRPFWQQGVSVLDVYRKIERELNEHIASAKPIEVHKIPPHPTWDLKRDFALRNKRLDYLTLKAVSKLNGSADTEMESGDVASPRHTTDLEGHHRLSFIPDEISDDEDDEGAEDAARLMGSLTKEDAFSSNDYSADD